MPQFLHAQAQLELEVHLGQVDYADEQQRVSIDHLQLGRARRHSAPLPYYPHSEIRFRLHSPRDHERLFAPQEPGRDQRVLTYVRQW